MDRRLSRVPTTRRLGLRDVCVSREPPSLPTTVRGSSRKIRQLLLLLSLSRLSSDPRVPRSSSLLIDRRVIYLARKFVVVAFGVYHRAANRRIAPQLAPRSAASSCARFIGPADSPGFSPCLSRRNTVQLYLPTGYHEFYAFYHRRFVSLLADYAMRAFRPIISARSVLYCVPMPAVMSAAGQSSTELRSPKPSSPEFST